MVTKRSMVPCLLGLALAGCMTDVGPAQGGGEDEETKAREDALVTNCSAFPQPAVPIKYDKEMVIRDLPVVNDSCRTTWGPPCAAGAGTRGRWTFGYMMAVMSGATGASDDAIVANPIAKEFVKKWLKLYLSNQSPNGLAPAAAPRTAITSALIKPWLDASGCQMGATIDSCPLDLKAAPFRLLAFVNRIDMSGGTSIYYGPSNTPGEFRVVFGALGYDPVTGMNNAPLQSTVILEYRFPTSKNAKTWATSLHALSDPALSQANYLANLQVITDGIVGPNKQIGRPNNGNAIGQIRTNEIAYDFNSSNDPAADPSLAEWEMREFRLPCASGNCDLAQAALGQTPDTSANNQAPLNNWILANRGSIKELTHALPVANLANASKSPSGVAAVVWAKPNPITAANAPDMPDFTTRSLTRHHFGILTCNGCHYVETSNQNGLFHIGPRGPNDIASVSQFLGAGAPDPLATNLNDLPNFKQQVNDPLNSINKFEYNEPWRRACEIRRILTGSTTPFTKPTGHPI